MSKLKDYELELEQVKSMLEAYKRQYDKLTLEFSKNPSEAKYEALGDNARNIIVVSERIKDIEADIAKQKKIEAMNKPVKYEVKYKGKLIDTVEIKRTNLTPFLTIADMIYDNISIEPATK